jgi:ABC-2 type transport system ATP-binding protein
VAAVLTCRDLWKRFGGRDAVRGLSFTVDAGEAYGLLGPNGAGKTTAIRMACGILRPDSGAVEVEGRAPSGAGPGAVGHAVGYVPQGLALFPTLTVVENLHFWGRLYGLPGRRRRRRIDDVLAMAGLTDRRGDRVEHCSGGMQRRLNLAIALLHEPRLLVLDEPTVGVDPQSRAALLDRIGELRDEGTAVLYPSHYMPEVQQLCDRVGVVDRGRLVVEGPPGSLGGGNGEDSAPGGDGDGAGDLETLFLELTGRQLRD